MANKLALLFLMFFLSGCSGSGEGANNTATVPGNIITVAGKGLGDFGIATTANLSTPMGVAVDSSGNLYIVDNGNNRIRKVTATTGIITTVAGNGTKGYSGDGGVATSASFNGLSGIAVDSAGNLFIVDNGNNIIRKVTAATGIITTVAGVGTAGYSGDGGLANSATLRSPNDIAVDIAGNLYIVDNGNNTIRKVTAATGIITTVAGVGIAGYSGDGGLATSAKLSDPFGVAVDSAGNLYIADNDNNVIRKITATTGIITTVAGNGIFGFSGDGGLATSATLNSPGGVAVDSNGNLYLVDVGNNVIRKVTVATGIITTVAGNNSYVAGTGTSGYSGDGGLATSAKLSDPLKVAIDGVGNIYIADKDNNRIRKVTASNGIITTMVGNGAPAYSGDGGLATSARLNFPICVAVDNSGNLFIVDFANNRIRKVNVATGIITTVAGNGTSGFSGDGGLATSAYLATSTGVAVDNAGNLYIAESSNNAIRKVTSATGIITTVAGSGTKGFSGDGGLATSAKLSSPTGVAVDNLGNLYIADNGNSTIRKVTAATGIITTVAGNGTSGFSGDGGLATSATFNSPGGVAVDSAGNLYISDDNINRIRKVTTTTGIITTIAGNGAAGYSGDGELATSASLNSPTGVAVDSTGNLYIADFGNSRIRKINTANGIITTVAGSGSLGYSGDGGSAIAANLSAPVGVAVDSAGNLYITDSGNNVIREVIK